MNSNECFFKNFNRIAHIALTATLSFNKWNSCPNIGALIVLVDSTPVGRALCVRLATYYKRGA